MTDNLVSVNLTMTSKMWDEFDEWLKTKPNTHDTRIAIEDALTVQVTVTMSYDTRMRIGDTVGAVRMAMNAASMGHINFEVYDEDGNLLDAFDPGCVALVDEDEPRFTSYQIEPCIIVDDGEVLPLELERSHEAEFWTLYGRNADGPLEAIGDFKDHASAKAIARKILNTGAVAVYS